LVFYYFWPEISTKPFIDKKMKKILFVLFAALFTPGGYAQNIQAHYDMGDGRGYLTTTVEMFRPDKMGSTFFFIDLDYGSNHTKGVSLAYFEIARSFRISESALQPRIEYNGGFFRMKGEGTDISLPVNDAWLAGLQYTWNSPDFARVFTLQANYKTIRDKNNASFQITGVWDVRLLKNKVTFSGFADFWRENNVVFDDNGNASDADFVFLTEPQVWYNALEHFSVGSEIEMSSNFSANKGFMINPTLAVKWTF
jgi:hypothetical protein